MAFYGRNDGKSLTEQQTPLCDLLGKKIGNDRLSIMDDPSNQDFAGARSFDDEGTPCHRRVLVEQGVFKGFVFDLSYGAKAGHPSTGNGYRTAPLGWGADTISFPPIPHLQFLTISPGSSSLSEMISDMDRGVLIANTLGGHSGNISNGDFSVGISPGLYVENGKIIGRIREGMIAGNVYDFIKNISCVESAVHWTPFGRFPALMFTQVPVVFPEEH